MYFFRATFEFFGQIFIKYWFQQGRTSPVGTLSMN
jgi:hypothetical protein